MITFTMEELRLLLDEQRRVVGENITRNLTVYTAFNKGNLGIDIEQFKQELKNECWKSKYPDDYNVLKKYHKDND